MNTIWLPTATGTCIFLTVSAPTKTNTAGSALVRTRLLIFTVKRAQEMSKGSPGQSQVGGTETGDEWRITRAEQARHWGSFPAAGKSAERALCNASRCSRQPHNWLQLNHPPELGSLPTPPANQPNPTWEGLCAHFPWNTLNSPVLVKELP